jgi:hypothetical protein
MPQLPVIPLYQFLDPYNAIADNIPIQAIIEALTFINDQVDIDAQILRESIGTQGTLANRLAQSINDNGTLKTTAINNALHDIEDHVDSPDFVRMMMTERTKLGNIDSDATNLSVTFNTTGGPVSFPISGNTIDIQPSTTIAWRYQSGSIYADDNFPSATRHTHYYTLTPVLVSGSLYETTSLATAYQGGTLRVYINGVRLTESGPVKVPIFSGSTYSMTSYSYTEGATDMDGIVENGQFTLSSSLPAGNVIFIDFDVFF